VARPSRSGLHQQGHKVNVFGGVQHQLAATVDDVGKVLVKSRHIDVGKKSMPKTFYKTIKKEQNFLTQYPTSFFSKIYFVAFFGVCLYAENTTEIFTDFFS
jgi:hypothetical protein